MTIDFGNAKIKNLKLSNIDENIEVKIANAKIDNIEVDNVPTILQETLDNIDNMSKDEFTQLLIESGEDLHGLSDYNPEGNLNERLEAMKRYFASKSKEEILSDYEKGEHNVGQLAISLLSSEVEVLRDDLKQSYREFKQLDQHELIMNNLLDKWNALDKPHKEFIYRAYKFNGYKYGCEPHFMDTDEIIGYDDETGEPYYKQIALWDLAEESGFVECVGSYKWVATDEFKQLYKYLLFGE